MKEVTAYEDNNGALHKKKRDAMEADFAIAVAQAWGALPSAEHKGDPIVIARLVSRSGTARERLLEALNTFSDYMADTAA